MKNNLEQMQAELDSPIPRSAVATRSGGGKALSYLETHYVIDRLNKVFGNMGWDSETVELTLLPGGVDAKPSYRAKVRITARIQVGEGQYLNVVKEGTGYGSDKSSLNPHEMAMKEAESDALKRAAMKYGQSMGLALYDKTQANVSDEAPAEGNAAPAAAPAASEERQAASERGAARATNPPATRPKFNRETVNKEITALSKVLIAQGRMKLEEIKDEMRKKYNTDVKEQLSDEQALELVESMKKTAG